MWKPATASRAAISSRGSSSLSAFGCPFGARCSLDESCASLTRVFGYWPAVHGERVRVFLNVEPFRGCPRATFVADRLTSFAHAQKFTMAARVIPVTAPDSDGDPSTLIELPCRCDAPLKTRTETPCPVHQDITFDADALAAAAGGDARLDAITFRNHYVAAITVSQKQGAAWVVVLRDQHLMRDPHCEDDAQAPATLQTRDWAKAFDPHLCGKYTDADGLPGGSLRIRLTQPSPVWGGWELRDVKCLMQRGEPPTPAERLLQRRDEPPPRRAVPPPGRRPMS